MSAYYKEITGLRAIAVSGVLICHLSASIPVDHEAARITLYRGWLGVDLFFVISGFLITEILLANKTAANYFSVFYSRRVLRIWPLYFLCIGLGFALIAAVEGWRALWNYNLGLYILFLKNLFDGSPDLRFLDMAWSVMVEEQFYLIWPLLVWLLPRRGLLLLNGVLLGCLPVARHIALQQGMPATAVYVNSLLHFDGLAAGSVLALIKSAGSGRMPRALINVARSLILPALALTLATSTPVSAARLTPYNPLCFSFAALSFFFLLTLVVGSSDLQLFRKFLIWKPVVWIGDISFGIYMLQRFAEHAAIKAVKPLGSFPLAQSPLFATLFVCGSFLLAHLSWRYFERPILRYKSRFEYKDQSSEIVDVDAVHALSATAAGGDKR